MNFIDKALSRINEMSVDDFLQSMADIYNEPIDRNEKVSTICIRCDFYY